MGVGVNISNRSSASNENGGLGLKIGKGVNKGVSCLLPQLIEFDQQLLTTYPIFL